MAILLNNVVNSYNKFLLIEDINKGLSEFSLGGELMHNDLQLCFGFQKTEPSIKSQIGKEFIMTTGVYKSYSDGIAKTIPSDNNESTQVIDIASHLNISNVSNCYAFGSLYLTLRLDVVAIEVSILKGLQGSGGQDSMPILMNKDISEQNIYKCLTNNGFFNTTISQTNLTDCIKICDFAIDILYFNSDSDYSMNVIVFDNRIPSAWGGYTEENMSLLLTPTILNSYKNSQSNNITYKKSLKQLINTWIQTFDNFVHYWTYNDTLPSELRNFINTEIGIGV